MESGGSTGDPEGGDDLNAEHRNATIVDVREAFELIFPATGARFSCMTFFADAIELAAQQGAARWIVSLRDPTQLTLSVGRAYVVRLHDGIVRIPLDAASLSQEAKKQLAKLSKPENEGFSSVPPSLTYRLPADKLQIARPLLATAHSVFIKQAAATAKQSPYANAHCPAAIDFLATELKRSLPRPEYETSAKAASKTRVLRLAETLVDVRKSIAVFAQTLRTAGEQVEWALQYPENWVCDASMGTFAPAKFAAFVDMTAPWYRELQQTPIPLFDGGRTRAHIEKLAGTKFRKDDQLLSKLTTFIADASNPKSKASKLGDLRFIELPAETGLWWVNQGKTVETALDAGYIWAPQEKKDNSAPYYYWSNVAKVKKGDVVFNYARKLIAVSLASSDGRTAPNSDSTGDEWEGDGWRADLDTFRLKESIPVSAFGDELTQRATDQGPMQPNGQIKMGYLFQLSVPEAEAVASQLPWSELPEPIRTRLKSLGIKAPNEETLMSTSIPLNQLLFGPPGTGKTFRTAALAVEICDGIVPGTRAATMERYKALHEAGQIAFVTFHQSYGYEEFVEGIRPVVAEDGDEEANGHAVRFECRPGVFRRMCASATTPLRSAKASGVVIDPTESTIWKMSLGNTQDPENTRYEEALDGNYISLDYGHGLDFTGCETREAILKKVQEKEPTAENDAFVVTAVHAFKNTMEIGDIVVVSDGNHKFRAIGRITGTYQSPVEGDKDQRRPVQWLARFEESLPREQISKRVFSQASIYRLRPSILNLGALNALLAGDEKATKNHVLIIDEINRGNVSKILGELITLLEPDKRLGRENELIVRLPHSGEAFGVPQNLYLIGTMNTADRSIAFLDTALRRRFEFVELMPDPSVVANHVGLKGGIDVAQLLTVVNQRIELLYDRDHTLGHAFFLSVGSLDDLRGVFVSKVIPLLQEYFYGDWEKLCQVLGCAFNTETGKPTTKNSAPIIAVTPLDPVELLSASDSAELRVRCIVNPAFRSASGPALRAFFDGIVKLPAPTTDN